MSAEPTDAEKIRLLPWSIGFYAANAVWFYLTFFGSVFVLFLSKLGLSKSEIGLLLSWLPFSGLIAPFIAPTVARWGYKRTFLVFYTGRMILTAFLLPTPWLSSNFGVQTTLLYIAGVVVVFGISRAVSLTALFPWSQEYVPNAVRGKYSAVNNIFTSLAGFLAVSAAGYVLGSTPGLDRFALLFAIGLASGVVSIWMIKYIPGGASRQGTEAEQTSYPQLLAALRDLDFLRYLLGAGSITLVAGPLVSFLPLFMQEQGGLDSGNVVLLQTGTLLGGLLSSYLWGWAADRYGSKPVMLSGASLKALLPIFWMLMPRHNVWTLYTALAIALVQGWADLGWVIGSGRLLYVSVVPSEKKTEYMALYYAWIGIIGGTGQLLAGRVLDLSAGVSGRFLFLTVDPYSILFAAGLVLALLGSFLLRSVRADGTVTTGEFASMFVRGNPLMAMESLIRYHWARDERAAVTMTERLGRTDSPLTVDELLEALEDPRFNVRFEAIVSIARRGPDDRLMAALKKVLAGSEPALSVITAWAMGRIGDKAAICALREGLDSPYRSVRAHCARSLGTLEVRDVIPLLLDRLAEEPDNGLRMAYAAALGKLRVRQAAGPLLALLRASQEPISRMEFALALARIVGDEHHFIQLVRPSTQAGTAISQAIREAKRGLEDLRMVPNELWPAIVDCAEAFAREELANGVALFSPIVRLWPPEAVCETCDVILKDCAERMDEFGADRIEYVALAVHALSAGIVHQRHRTFTRAFPLSRAKSPTAEPSRQESNPRFS